MPHNWKLEQRSCLCGCGATFKVLPSSGSLYASKKHEKSSKEKMASFVEIEEMPEDLKALKAEGFSPPRDLD